jgi:tripartite-type tricarboxylate transporter receptor subunit TctC
MLHRRSLLQSGAALSVLALHPLARAQAVPWPERPVKLINGFAAGGASDILTRQLAQRLQQRLGQPFIVENRPGAGGNISMEAVAKAPADGYTVCSATIGTLSINQFLYSKLSFDPVKDFVAVSTFWENTNVLVIPATHPAKDFKEWLAWARSQSEGITYSSSGIGTTPHLSGAAFAQKVGIKAIHVPFKGGAQASAELAAGRIDCSIDNIVNQTPMLRGARVRALAVTYRERWPSLPDVPTMAEVGISDFVVTSWGALVLPAATPMAIVEKFSKVVQEISRETAMQEQFFNTGAKFVSASPQETAAFAARERVKWRDAVTASGAKVE